MKGDAFRSPDVLPEDRAAFLNILKLFKKFSLLGHTYEVATGS